MKWRKSIYELRRLSLNQLLTTTHVMFDVRFTFRFFVTLCDAVG